MPRNLKISESLMASGERRIPRLAAKSGEAAYQRALAFTGGVMVKIDDKLIERRSDGAELVIKALPPGKRVKVGTVLKRAR